MTTSSKRPYKQRKLFYPKTQVESNQDKEIHVISFAVFYSSVL